MPEIVSSITVFDLQGSWVQGSKVQGFKGSGFKGSAVASV